LKEAKAAGWLWRLFSTTVLSDDVASCHDPYTSHSDDRDFHANRDSNLAAQYPANVDTSRVHVRKTRAFERGARSHLFTR
jgi:hypothetical protein